MAGFKGVGKKLAIYVPREDEFVIAALEQVMDTRIREGYRTSLSFELVKALKEGLAGRGLNLDALRADFLAKNPPPAANSEAKRPGRPKKAKKAKK